MPENSVIELFNEDEDTVLGIVPPRIIKWGMTMIFIVVIGLIIFSMIFVYPDVVSGAVTVNFSSSPSHMATGILKLPSKGSGKVRAGQMVNIKVDNYPYMEFGTLTGIVEHIDSVPSVDKTGSYYKTMIQLPNGRNTDLHKQLGGFQVVEGTGEVITAKSSLFDRILKPLRLDRY